MTYIMTGCLALSSCAVSDNPVADDPVFENDNVLTKLGKMPQVSDIQQVPDSLNSGFKEAYLFSYEQPIDHQNPAAGTYKQKVMVCIRDVNAPTVVYTHGYLMSDKNYANDTDLAVDLGANYVAIEHRYFGDSKIDSDTRWDYLTTQQAADDQYAVIQSLKTILKKEWVSIGTSKCGMTSMFLRYYHPDAVDVTTVFCSPFMTSLADKRVGRYQQTESGSQAEKELIDAHMKRMLANGREGLYKTVCQKLAELAASLNVQENSNIPFENYVHFVISQPFGLYSYSDAQERATIIPPVNCSDEAVIDFYFAEYFEKIKKMGNQPANYWEKSAPLYPYSIQTAKQLGQYAYDYTLVEDLLKGMDFDYSLVTDVKKANTSNLFECDTWLYDTYDNTMMLDLLNNFLPTCQYPILFVYSKDDPWTGARPAKINESVAKLIINPDGIHNQDINNPRHYSEAVYAEIYDYVTRYVKLPQSIADRRGAGRPQSVDREVNDRFMLR